MQCVDASVSVIWIFPEEHSSEALALVRDCARRGERLIAPPLLPIETNNTIRQRMRRGSLLISDARGVLDAFLAFPVMISSSSASEGQRLHQRALELADRFGLPAIYDAYYLALADLHGCTLWTADRGLLTAVSAQLPGVRFIGDYHSE